MFERLFLAVPCFCLRFVIVVFPDHIHLQFLKTEKNVGAFTSITDCLEIRLMSSFYTNNARI